MMCSGIVERAQQGDRRAFGMLAAEVIDRLYGVGQDSPINGTTRVPVESGSVWDPGGLTGTNELMMSDDRVSGATTQEIHCDRVWEYEDATSVDCRTTMTISNGGGAWEGVVIGTSSWTRDNPLHVHHMSGTLVGTGGYEGLRFVMRMDGSDYPWSVAGTIEPDR